MKLRLPLSLASALLFSYAASGVDISDSNLSGKTVTEDTNFIATEYCWSDSSTIIGVAGGGVSPVINIDKYLLICSKEGVENSFEVLSGKVNVKKDSGNFWGYAYSVWIGKNDAAGGSILSVRGGEFTAKSVLLGGGTKASTAINLYGGTTRFSGIYNGYQNTASQSKPGALNLMGGSLLLGEQGLWAIHSLVPGETLTSFAVNLYRGTLGAYASWSSGDKTWTSSGEAWTLASELSEEKNCLIWQLDYVGAVLPDGTASDGAGNLNIAPAEGTTITVGSLIKGDGTGNLTKTDKGTLLILAGSTGNTFTQNIVLESGTLEIDKDSALGVLATGSSEKAKTISVTGNSTFLTRSNTSELNFAMEDGVTLTFGKYGDVVTDFKGKFTGTGSYVFEGPVGFHGGGGEKPADQLVLASGKTFTARGQVSLKNAFRMSVYGQMDIIVPESGDGSTSVGLHIAGNAGGVYNISQFIIGDGGVLNMANALVDISHSQDSGNFIIRKGGAATIKGLKDSGNWGKTHVDGGILNLGAEGIKLGKRGAHTCRFFISDGKLVLTETSSFAFTGSLETEDIGYFILGKAQEKGAPAIVEGSVDEGSVRILETQENVTFTIEGKVIGQGGFNKTGKGTVALMKANGYEGDTVVEDGTLHLGDDASLGTPGKLTLLSGTTLAALGKSLTIANNLDMGAAEDTEYGVTYGQSGKTDALTLNGETRLLSTGTAAFNTLSDVTFGGNVASSAETLTKTGAGTLSFTQTLTGVQTMNVNAGGLVFEGTAFEGVKTLNMAANTTLDLGGQAGAADKNINIAGSTALKGFGSYAGAIALKETTNRLNVTGNFQAGKISFNLGKDNASYDGAVKTLVTTDGTAAITGTEKGITLNFDQDYINTFLSQGGTFQLFSTGLSYQKGTILNNQRKLILVDESQLGTTGALTWSRIEISADLITQEMANGMNTYVPTESQSYLGSQGGTVVVGGNVVYDLAGDTSYNLTPGLGTLVYRGILSGTGKELSVLGYSEIKGGAESGAGSVVITNNGNNYDGGTIVTGGRLTVDLSQGTDPGSLAGQAQNGNLNVTALGTGTVNGVSGAKGSSEIILQAYGDQTLAGVNSYTYANNFALSGNSILKQTGANAQILTGDITSGAGANTIANAGSKDLALKGNITQEDGESLTLRSETASGKIVLDGGKTLTASQLNITGAGEIRTANGYAVTTKGLTLANGTLNIAGGGTLTVGQNGVTGTGTLVLNGGTIKSSSSWSSDITITLGTGENTISTGGANIHLNKGVTGEGGFIKQGSGHLYLYDNPAGNAKGQIDVKQGRLVLLGAWLDKARTAADPATEYKLSGDLVLESGKGASLQGKINANGHNVTFGDGTHYYLEVAGESGVTGYIHDAGTLTIGTGTQLHVDVLDDSWATENTYTIFSAREDIQGASNLQLTLNEEYAFVDISLDLSDNKEIGLNLTRKGGTPGGLTNDGTNKGAIHAVVAPLVAGVLDNNTELTGKLHKHMQTISKMTTTEYQTYLTDMGFSASSYYTALSAQVQDATQHLNSVRNRVELLNPVLYDDWTEGGIYNVWAGGINHYRDVKSGAEAPGYEMTSWGGELGCAIPLSQTFMIGVGFAYTFADVQVKDGWGSNDNDTYNVDVFARYRKDALTITGVLTGGFTNTEFHRNQILKDEYTRSNSSTDGNQFMGTIEAGYDFYLNEEKSWILQPLVNLTAGRAKLDSLSETGELKNAGLMIGSQSYNMFSAGIGAKIAYQYKNSVSDQPGRVELKAMYVNDMGDVDFKVNGRFIGAPGNGFDLDGVSNERSAAIVSAGWIAPISAFGQFFVDAGCEFRKDQNGVNTTAGFSFQF